MSILFLNGPNLNLLGTREPALYGHTSLTMIEAELARMAEDAGVALRDALAAVGLPFIEVHISNVFQREPFRHHSYLSGLAAGVICGLGVNGYQLALQHALTVCRPPARA